MQQEALNFSFDGENSGLRLYNFELYNWGTFHQKVWSLCSRGETSLLTGDIGSGKSTVVDALTTLLVPPNKIIYNKAAGSEVKERTLLTYVLGVYKGEKSTTDFHSKQVSLRDERDYSILLVHFRNEQTKQDITLVQILRVKTGNQVERIYLIADRSLSIVKDLSSLGHEWSKIKSSLKPMSKVEIFDSFKSYAFRFAQMSGLQSEKAMDLFFQTVSMKSVGNLTDFVRKHMLEKEDVENKIEELCQSFDDLNRLHQRVVKSRLQRDRLIPLVNLGKEANGLLEDLTFYKEGRNNIDVYFQSLKEDLIEQRQYKQQAEQEKLSQKIGQTEEKIRRERENQVQLRSHIEKEGGGRIDFLNSQLKSYERDKELRLKKSESFNGLLEKLDLNIPENSDQFIDCLSSCRSIVDEVGKKISLVEKENVDNAISISNLKKEQEVLIKEVESLKKRRTNIPLKSLRMREKLVSILDCDEEDLPFIGELLQVRPNEKEWEGAIERVLHSFSLSLIVPESLYHQVGRVVDQTDLKGRLVYFRVKNEKHEDHNSTVESSLVHKIEIHPETPYYDWLKHEMIQRFDFHCADSLDDFTHYPRAITRQGQVKSGPLRHEKDDRYRIDDRSRYNLGWSNEEKVYLLEKNLKNVQEQGYMAFEKGQKLTGKISTFRKRIDQAKDVLRIEDFEEVHWQSLVAQIEEIHNEIKEIKESNNILGQLQKDLQVSLGFVEEFEKNLRDQTGKIAVVKNELEQLSQELTDIKDQLKEVREEIKKKIFPFLLEKFKEQYSDKETIGLRGFDKRRSEFRARLNEQIGNLEQKFSRRQVSLVRLMTDFIHSYKEETKEMDASLQSLPEYENFLQKIVEENLPQYEKRFREKLNKETVNGMAMLQDFLSRQRRSIEDKIEVINDSLSQIDYNTGSYITLVLEKSHDGEIRDFQNSMRQCLSFTLDDEDIYTEKKFLQVKEIIDRFKGREGLSELDQRWAKKVTDVRNWFLFAASERWREDNSEKEFYSDSSGKSGGQKEKLAYTILASALSYQFGVTSDKTEKSFRFVMIDEAFGRGSDESTRYALGLFSKLNLQLLIVTPLQKIHVIENFINSIHFVHNDQGKNSSMSSLTITDYKKNKKLFIENKDNKKIESDVKGHFAQENS